MYIEIKQYTFCVRLNPAPRGYNVHTNKARKIHFVSGSIRLRGYNVHRNKAIYILCPAQSSSEVTMYIEIKQYTFCVWLNPALRLQCT